MVQTRNTIGSHSQDQERIAVNETADRNNSVDSADMGNACDAGFEHKNAEPTHVTAITVASEALGQGDTMTKKKHPLCMLRKTLKLTRRLTKKRITLNLLSISNLAHLLAIFQGILEDYRGENTSVV